MGIRRLVPALVAALFAVVVAWGTPTCASACSCVGRTVAEQAADADFVARVVLTKVDPPVDDTYATGVRVYTFRVNHVWKGEVVPAGEVRSEAQGSACGLEFIDVGDDVVLFGYSEGGQLVANLCGGTAKAEAPLVAEVTSALGAGQAVAQEPETRPSDGSAVGAGGWGVWMAVAGGVLLVGAVVALLLSRGALRRRP